MEIRELRYFAAVYSERNLTAAARRCFISQPSISAAIANLEAELGTTLFIRHKKGGRADGVRRAVSRIRSAHH